MLASLITKAGGEVIHRAIPHTGDWHAFKVETNIILIAARNPVALERAQVARGDVDYLWQARANIARAWQDFFAWVGDRMFLVCPYEALESYDYQRALCVRVGLEPTTVPFYDANWKHLELLDRAPMQELSPETGE